MTDTVSIIPAIKAVTCDANGYAKHTLTVINESAEPICIAARTLVDNLAHESWLSIDGPKEWELNARASSRLVVTIQVPAHALPGRYTYRVLVFTSSSPSDTYTEGPRVSFQIRSKPSAVAMSPHKAKKIYPAHCSDSEGRALGHGVYEP